MSGQPGYVARTRLGRIVNAFEETAIAVLLGLMTMVTFVNVVLRYGFNQSLIWGLEVTLILFAWLVLFGISYGFKVTAHLGVDAVTGLFPPAGRKALALISAACCIAYAGLLMKGAWDYYAPFAALQPTTGRWFPTGIAEGVRDRAFYVTDQVPMLGIFRWLEGAINYGDAYDKLPRVVPYTILPVGAALILLRVIEATVDLFTGRRQSLIVSHEAEDAVDDPALRAGPEDAALRAGSEDAALRAGSEDAALRAGPEDTALRAGPEDAALRAGPEDAALRAGKD